MEAMLKMKKIDIAALKRVFERNAVVLSEDTEADVFALAEDELALVLLLGEVEIAALDEPDGPRGKTPLPVLRRHADLAWKNWNTASSWLCISWSTVPTAVMRPPPSMIARSAVALAAPANARN